MFLDLRSATNIWLGFNTDAMCMWVRWMFKQGNASVLITLCYIKLGSALYALYVISFTMFRRDRTAKWERYTEAAPHKTYKWYPHFMKMNSQERMCSWRVLKWVDIFNLLIIWLFFTHHNCCNWRMCVINAASSVLSNCTTFAFFPAMCALVLHTTSH